MKFEISGLKDKNIKNHIMQSILEKHLEISIPVQWRFKFIQVLRVFLKLTFPHFSLNFVFKYFQILVFWNFSDILNGTRFIIAKEFENKITEFYIFKWLYCP